MADDTAEEDIELVYPPIIEAPIMDMPMPGEEAMGAMMVDESVDPCEVVIHSARIRSATLLPEPAFVEAKVFLGESPEVSPTSPQPVLVAAAVGAHSTPTSDSPWDGPAAEKSLPSPMPVATARAFYAWIDDAAVSDEMITKVGGRFGHHEVADGTPGAANIKACQSGIGVLNGGRGGTTIPGVDIQGVYDHLASHLRDADLEPPSLVATAGPGPTVITSAAYTITIPEVWPEEWFEEPTELPPFGAVHITAAGRLYGLLAPSAVSHRAFRSSGRTVTAPRGIDFSEFQNKPCLVAGADGHVYRINAGSVTFGCGHASPLDPRRADPDWAMAHYDNTCSIAARVRVGERSDGSTWVAGGLLHGITADTFERMMACALSGDWQDGKLNAALLVPVEGFPRPATASVRVREDALVSSSVPLLMHRPASMRPALERIARGVGRDAASRMSALYERVRR